ncbi:MAG: ribonuclease HI family protein [Candidatus Thermoplasmatota archaeon]|nr:ribonuclease HI family protein [Candidatus Thermoplasmatota archaeon]
MIYVYTDGASRGNPGMAAAGFMIFKGTQKVFEDFRYLGIATNNEAEYKALIFAMKKAKMIDKNASIFSDSELMIKQLTGIYRVKSERLRELFRTVKDLEREFLHVSYQNLPRENEGIAAVDKKLNMLLNSIGREDL